MPSGERIYFEWGPSLQWVAFVLLAIGFAAPVIAGMMLSRRRCLDASAATILAACLAAVFALAMVVFSPVVVADPQDGSLVHCASAPSISTIRGVPDDSSMLPVQLACRSDGRFRLGGCLGLLVVVLAANARSVARRW
ncbi:hypothetical protein [Kribbella deserti]|uniref:Uncharacterized protein n=1 Tax=Kribbella deserti TaxID=1926257 RepID=A0ABV6QLE0_9ACTN